MNYVKKLIFPAMLLTVLIVSMSTYNINRDISLFMIGLVLIICGISLFQGGKK